MKVWQTLPGDVWEDVGADYGPQTQAVVNTPEVLGKITCFPRVSAPKPGWPMSSITIAAPMRIVGISGRKRSSLLT